MEREHVMVIGHRSDISKSTWVPSAEDMDAPILRDDGPHEIFARPDQILIWL